MSEPAPSPPDPKEPRNPLYLLLLIIGVLFAVTAIAYTIVPVIEEKALRAGQVPPPSPWRDALRTDGWRWLLYELAALIVVGFLSMGVDRYRRWRRERLSERAAKPADMPRG